MAKQKVIKRVISQAQSDFIQNWGNEYQTASGAIRSGKTYAQLYKLREFLVNIANHQTSIIISGRTGDAVERNVVEDFLKLQEEIGELKKYTYHRQPRMLRYLPKKINCWVVGGNDEEAEKRIRGMTSQAIFGDEVSTQPQKFFQQCVGRTSAGKRYKILTTNPDAPTHWLKTDVIDNPDLDVKNYEFRLADNPSLDKGYIAGLYAMYKGVDKDRYLEGKWAANTEELIVPEIHELEAQVVKEWERPPKCHKIVAMDPGFDDYCAIIFGYYDFENAKGVVEDSLFLRGANTQGIAEAIQEKERELWGNEEPYGRYSDVDKILVTDLRQLHGISFSIAKKGQGNKASKVNKIRVMMGGNELVILPKNKKLIYQLKTGQWTPLKMTAKGDETRDFIRTAGERHFDGVDALGDFCRYLPVDVNPNPHRQKYPDSYHVNPAARADSLDEARMMMFGSRKF